MDLYEFLGISRAATLIEIKRSYRRLARKHHPDINPGDHAAEARFKDITRAYETLSDPSKRQRYDASGGASTDGTTTVTYGFEGFDFSAAGAHGVPPTFGDLFAEVFNRHESAAQGEIPERGADLFATTMLTFEDAMRGVLCQLAVTRRESCRSCRATGVLSVAEARCQRCQGTGTLRSQREHMVFAKSCPTCGGTGRQVHTACSACAGSGTDTHNETLTIRIPAGVSDGSRIRVPEKGNAGLRGGGVGDLYVTINVQPHEMFRREGDDFHIVVPIAVHEAALGAGIDVPAPDGLARFKVPPGTQSGQRFRVRGRGAPSPRDGRRGDLVVEVKLVLPRLLDERSKELLREFGKINNDDVRKELPGKAAVTDTGRP